MVHCMVYFWSNYSALTRPHPKWWLRKGNPLISGKPRLVKYYNLARYLHEGFVFVCFCDGKKCRQTWPPFVPMAKTQQSMTPRGAVGAALGGGNRQQVRRRAVGRTVEWLGFVFTSRWLGKKGREGKGTPWRADKIVPRITNQYEFSTYNWVVVSNMLFFFTPKIGEDSHFD